MDNTPLHPMSANSRMQHFTISAEGVHQQLINLNPSKSEGADKIHPKILASIACYLPAPLVKLFNNSLETGIIPVVWNRLPLLVASVSEQRKFKKLLDICLPIIFLSFIFSPQYGLFGHHVPSRSVNPCIHIKCVPLVGHCCCCCYLGIAPRAKMLKFSAWLLHPKW